MKKKLVIVVIILLIQHSFGQIETISGWEVGNGGDFVDLPLDPTYNFSHSQVIYYANQLQFRGYIDKISLFSIFSYPSNSGTPIDPTQYKLKFALTTIDEFGPAQSFIPDSEFTEATNVIASNSGMEFFYEFDTPFYYDGTQNLVIDWQDFNPASQTGSGLAGNQGSENFGNPPKRSIFSRTTINDDDTTSTITFKQNAYPRTKFYGSLERCAWVSARHFENITHNSADIYLTANENVVSVIRYNVTKEGEEIPDTYQTTTDRVLSLTNLLPAQRYFINVKSDCDTLNSPYRSYSFKTRPNILTVPYTIDFDDVFQRDYELKSRNINGIELSTDAGNNSLNGVLMYGKSYPGYLQWETINNPFEENPSFERTIMLDVDLTQNTTNPILKLDILQHISFFRFRITDLYDSTEILEDYYYKQLTPNDTNFRKIVLDLSDYVGRMITINLDHVSKSDIKFTKIDNIELVENDCVFEPTINTNIFTDNFTLNWNSDVMNHDYIIVNHNEMPNINIFNSINTTQHIFSNLDIASPYNIYLRKQCANSTSPWFKYYISTDPTPITVPYNSELKKNDISSDFFTINYNDASRIWFGWYNNNSLSMHQTDSNAVWVGGDSPTEFQAWNSNLDFVTTLKFKIDATTLSDLMMDVRFKQYHYYYGNPLTSWFRILVNGNQVGSSYNPLTKDSDPIQEKNINLDAYIGDIITVEFQQVGKSKHEFSFGALSGDSTYISYLNLSGTDTASVPDEDYNSNVNIYPNPASNKIWVSMETPFNSYKIYNLTGKLIENKKLSNTKQKYQLNIQDLSKGVYFLILQSDTKSFKKIFIKK